MERRIIVRIAGAMLLVGCTEDTSGDGAGGGRAGAGVMAGASQGGGAASGGAGGTTAGSIGESGSTAGGGAAGAGTDAGPDAALGEGSTPPPHHLGAPFTIVGGLVAPESNEYGMDGSYFVIHNELVTSLDITDLDGQLCISGTIAPQTPGDTNTIWAFSIGFILDPDHGPTTARPIIIDPVDQRPWDLGGGSVIGMSARFVGSLIPRNLGFGAIPGGMNPDDASAQYGDCSLAAPAGGSGERLLQSYFAELHAYCWNVATLDSTGWAASSAISFSWAAGSDAADNPFNFCITDIRPIISGAGPDVAAPTPPDGGVEATPDAAAGLDP